MAFKGEGGKGGESTLKLEGGGGEDAAGGEAGEKGLGAAQLCFSGEAAGKVHFDVNTAIEIDFGGELVEGVENVGKAKLGGLLGGLEGS